MSIEAGTQSLAAYRALKPRSDIESWLQNPHPDVNHSEWQKDLVRLQAALALDPDSPEYEELLGRLFAIRAQALQNLPSQRLTSLRESLAHHRRAATLRPTWPFSHMNVAVIKHLLGEHDAVFEHAFLKANQFGPFTPQIQDAMLEVGFAAWPFASEKTRDSIDQLVLRIRASRKAEVEPLIEGIASASAVCTMLGRIPTYCPAQPHSEDTLQPQMLP